MLATRPRPLDRRTGCSKPKRTGHAPKAGSADNRKPHASPSGSARWVSLSKGVASMRWVGWRLRRAGRIRKLETAPAALMAWRVCWVGIPYMNARDLEEVNRIDV